MSERERGSAYDAGEIVRLGCFIAPYVQILPNTKKRRIRPEVVGLPRWTADVFTTDWVVIPNEHLMALKETTRQIHSQKRRLCLCIEGDQDSGSLYFLPAESLEEWQGILARLTEKFHEEAYAALYTGFESVRKATEASLFKALKQIHAKHKKDAATLFGELTDEDTRFYTTKLMQEKFPNREELSRDYRVGCRRFTAHPDDPQAEMLLQEIKESLDLRGRQPSLFS